MRHLNQLHRSTPTPAKEVNVCVVCGRQFADNALFLAHQNTKHHQVCRFCGTRFGTFHLHKSHILKHHMNQLTVAKAASVSPLTRPRPQKMACKMCALVFSDMGIYRRHMANHSRANGGAGGPSSSEKVPPDSVDNILRRLTSLGSEITLQPVKPASPPSSPPGLGLVISSVQSVSMSFLEDLDRQSEELRRKRQERRQQQEEVCETFDVSPEVVVEVKRRSSASSEEARSAMEKHSLVAEVKVEPNGGLEEETPKGDKNGNTSLHISELHEVKQESLKRKTETKLKKKAAKIIKTEEDEDTGMTRRSSSRSQGGSMSSAASLFREEGESSLFIF